MPEMRPYSSSQVKVPASQYTASTNKQRDDDKCRIADETRVGEDRTQDDAHNSQHYGKADQTIFSVA